MAKQAEDDSVKKPHSKDDFSNEKNLLDLLECVEDPLYFMKNFMKIQHALRGSIPFDPYPYQVKIINGFHKNRNTIAMTGRQMGKTTCAAGFLLWKAMFTPDMTILIVANKYVQALEIMERIRYTYENCPNHIRAGVTEYNKGNITFDNGSRIISRATSTDAGRGLAVSLLYCDEFAFIPPNKQKEFWASVKPVLATGGSCIVTSTPRTDEDQFAQIWKSAIDTTDSYGNPKEDGLGKNGWFALESPWTDMIGHDPMKNESWANEERETLGTARFEQEYNCKFFTDEETLINPMCLKRLTDRCKDPSFYVGTTRWFAEPRANKGYLVSLDPAVGTGGDFAAIQVFQMPEMIQVAEWSHNHTQARGQVKTLMQILLWLDQELRDKEDQMGEPEIYWTFENNGIGMQVAQIIEDSGEERFPGILVSDGRRPGAKFRVKGTYTSKNKINECARLKSLLESDRMHLSSRNLVKEMKYFIAADGGATYRAKIGEHDDLISATLMIIRLLDYVMRWEDRSTNALREHIEDDEIMEIDPLPIVI